MALVVSEETGSHLAGARRHDRTRLDARGAARPAADPRQRNQHRAERRFAASRRTDRHRWRCSRSARRPQVLSIGVATLLWLVVAGDRVVERALRVPLEFQNLPDGLEIVGDPPEDGRRAPARSVGHARAARRRATCRRYRSAERAPGRRLFHLTATQITVPYGVEVVQVAPATLPIAFENSARPDRAGAARRSRAQPAPGYEVGDDYVRSGDRRGRSGPRARCAG